MVLLILRRVGVSHRWRRVGFAALATVSFAPAIVPAGIITTAIVPYGILALAGSLPMLHQPRLAGFPATPFLGTLVLSSVAAFFVVRKSEDIIDSRNARSRAVNVSLPVVVLFVLIAFYYSLVPDRIVARHIDRDLIESNYGELLDEVDATLEIEDVEGVLAARERIASSIESQEIIMSVSLHDRRLRELGVNARTVFRRSVTTSGRGCSSTGDGKYREEGLMRCTWNGGLFGDVETLKYTRNFRQGDYPYQLRIEFEYREFLDNYPN